MWSYKGTLAPIFVHVIRKTWPLYFAHAIHKVYFADGKLKQVKFFILSENFLLCEIPFHIVNCLKSFHFKLFFVYVLTCWGGPFHAFARKFCFCLKNIWLVSKFIKRGSKVVHQFLTKNGKTQCETLKGSPTASLKKGCPMIPFLSPPLSSTPVSTTRRLSNINHHLPSCRAYKMGCKRYIVPGSRRCWGPGRWNHAH